jgi:archaellum component FlaC
MSLHLVHFWQERTRAAYGDVVRLEEENARLKAEVERFNTGIQPEGSNDAVGRAVNVLLEKEKEIERLKAEVEHLTSENLLVREEADRYCRLWQEAKEGKPSV